MTTPTAASNYRLGDALDLMRVIFRLNHSLETFSSSMARRLEVSVAQHLLLRCIGRFPGITPGRLAHVLHVDPGTISSTLRRLCEKGLVDRRPDPRDARRLFLGLTQEGHRIDTSRERTLEHVVGQLLKDLSPEHIETVKTILNQLAGLLESPEFRD